MVKFLWVGRLILEFLAFPIWTDLLSIFAKAYRYSYYVRWTIRDLWTSLGRFSGSHRREKPEKSLVIPPNQVRQKLFFYRKYQVKIQVKMTVPEARIAIDFQEFIFKISFSLRSFSKYVWSETFWSGQSFFSPGQMLNSRSLQRVFSAESFGSEFFRARKIFSTLSPSTITIHTSINLRSHSYPLCKDKFRWR